MIVSTEMKTLWKLHGVILINSPELAMLRLLAKVLANGGVEVVSVDDVLLADYTIGHRHLLAGILAQGGHGHLVLTKAEEVST